MEHQSSASRELQLGLKEGAAMFDKIRLRDVLVDYKLDFVSNE